MLRRSRTTATHVRTCLRALLPLLLCSTATSVHAQALLTYNWTDGDGNGLWSDFFNWDAGTPGSDSRNQLYFNINDGVNNVVNDIGQLQLNLLRFDSMAAPFNVSGSALEFITNSSTDILPQLVQESTSNITISNNLILDNTLTVAGKGSGTGTMTLSGAISGVGGFTNQSTLTILTNPNNTYTGGTTVIAGTLQLGVNNGLPSGSNLAITGLANTSTFNLNGYNQNLTNLTFGNGTSVHNLLFTGAGTLTLQGNITFDGPAANTLPAATIDSNIALSTAQHAFDMPSGHSSGSYDVVASGLISGGGGLTLNNGIRVALTYSGNTYTGATNISAGSLYLGAANALSTGTAVTVTSTGTLYSYIDQTQSGVPIGVYNQSIGSLAGQGLVVLGSANSTVITGGAILTTGNDNTNTTFSGTIEDNGQGGSVVKVGTGTWTLSGTNTYTGSTTIDAGTLLLGTNNALPTGGGSVPATDLILYGGNFDTGGKNQTVNNVTNSGGTVFVDGSASTVTVNGTYAQSAGATRVDGNLALASTLNLSGGDLVGTGTITGNVNNSGGRLSPGDLLSSTPTGTLAISGNYTQAATGFMEIDLGGTQQGVSYDLLKVGSLATLAGELDVKLVNGYAPLQNQTFDFLTYSTLSGGFNTVVAENSGYEYSVSFAGGTGILTVLVAPAVPESSTLLAMGLMLATGGLLLRRKRLMANIAIKTG
jgi:fibronectin-binding autotransporter adhesin